jgi:hypothetical protein
VAGDAVLLHGLGADLDREDLADREVPGAGPGRGEEEYDDPEEGLARGVQQARADSQALKASTAPEVAAAVLGGADLAALSCARTASATCTRGYAV